MADKSSSLEKELKKLNKRLERLESKIETGFESGEPQKGEGHCHGGGDGGNVASCLLPEVPERTFGSDVSSFRASLIRYIDKKWVNGTKLKYYFFNEGSWQGIPSNVALVRRGFEAWENVGIGIEFEETTDINEAQVRIGFLRGDGAWSYVGRDVIDIPGPSERTMNFGWDLTRDPRGGGLDTPIHEIGHTLGFPHEHQNPFAGIVWNEEAVYEHFAGDPNFWNRSTTFHNVLRKLNTHEVTGSNWDPNSIMHYSFPAGLIREPAEYRGGLRPTDGLTETDKEEVRRFYPPMNPREDRKLEPFSLQHLSLEPAEQANFVIEPTRSDEFTIQTFGRSDVVMVLFEENQGEFEFVAGDDDSGENFNARITTRLFRNRRYVLRVRMYLNYASGDSAVLMW